ncbi:MAG: RNA-binding cell elongation regulator Jag/EloR [Caldilineaceae bacterium]
MSVSGAQEFSGKSVDEAVAEGLRKLGLRSDQVTIDIINKGSRGLFGLGSEPAVVRLAPRPAVDASPAVAVAPPAPPAPATPATATVQNVPEAPRPAAPIHAVPTAPAAAAPAASAGRDAHERATEMVSTSASAPTPAATPVAPVELSDDPVEQDAEIAALAAGMLNNVVRLMGFDARVDAEWRDADDITEERHLLLRVHGRDVSALIGRRGETLENLQYLLRLMVNQRMHRWLNIIVDVEDYRSKRVEHLTHLAQRMADQVAETARAFALEPMPPNERRIVHLALRDDTRIFTESTGEGERRKVNIFPRK